MKLTRVAIYLFPQVELLDFAGPYEVFTAASRVAQKRSVAHGFEVFSVARTDVAVAARAGIKLVPDFTFANCPVPDLLIIPGGVVDDELKHDDLHRWIVATSRSAKVIASVCTGAFILAQTGLLEGRAATTHWEDIEDLRQQYPNLDVREGVRWVESDPYITSAGIAAGISMSLHLVSRLASPELAEATARQLEVPYYPQP